MTDSQIVMGIMQNDDRVWRHICRNMKPGFAAVLCRAFSHAGLSGQDVEDIFQESCVVLMRKVKNGEVKAERDGALFAYLVKTGKLTACNIIRKKRPLVSEEEILAAAEFHVDDDEYDISIDERQQSQDEFLDRVFDSLPDDCRMMLKKFYWDHMPMDEIAGMMGLRNADTAKTKKSRCMGKLKDIAGKLIENDEFAEEAVRAAVERAALRELLAEESVIMREAGVIKAALDVDDEHNGEK